MERQLVLDALRKEALRLEEDATYSSKGHFNAASAWERTHYFVGTLAGVLAAGAGAAIFKEKVEAAMLVSVLAAAFTSVVTFLNPQDHANKHRQAGGQYSGLKNQTRIFRTVDLIMDREVDVLLARLTELSALRDKLNTDSPTVPWHAFVGARRGIEAGEAKYQADNPEPS